MEIFKIGFAAFSGAFFSVMGGNDAIFIALLFCLIVDFTTGLIKGLMMKSEKSDSGAINSTVMFRGGMKKVLVLIIVAFSHQFDQSIGIVGVDIRNMVVMYFIAVEGLSILENVGQCGVPLPGFLTKVLERVKDSNNDLDEDNV